MSPDSGSFSETFDRLAGILSPYRSRLVSKSDEPGHLYLDTPPSPKYPKGFFFGMVKTGKRYVSFHLMPVYTHPDLLEGISPALRQRMEGKSCFNFTRVDEPLFTELARQTAVGFARYEEDGTIPA